MYIEDTLVRYVLDNVWCSPMEDEVSTIQLKRLTKKNGEFNNVTIFHDDYNLPTSRERYHVYMLGGNYPQQFTLPEEFIQWINMKKWCANNSLICHFYSESGIVYPLTNIYYLREEDGNIIFAVKIDDSIVNLNDTHLYVRFYHNTFWSTEDGRKLPYNRRIIVSGGKVKQVNIDETKDLFNLLRENLDDKRRLTVFHNGKLVNNVSKVTDKEDNLELIYDGSIKKDYWFRISQLPSFLSKLDEKQKYLVHIPRDENTLYDVNYHDDVEIFLVKVPEFTMGSDGDTIYDKPILDSRYYYRHARDSVRMVTHQSYSLPVDYVMKLIRYGNGDINLDEWFIRVIVKDGGLKRKLVNDKHHLRELYRLPNRLLLEAMVGTNATVEKWRAENLETNPYLYLMRAYRHEVTQEKTLEGLGYVSTSRVLSNPPVGITRDNTGDYFLLPVGTQNESMVYEYTVSGKLNGFYYHNNDFKYTPKHKDTVFIEVIAGVGGINPEVYINPPHSFELLPQCNYRAYKSTVVDEIVTGDWVDVTLNPSYWQQTSTHGICQYDNQREVLVVMGDAKWLAYNTTISAKDGVYDFTLVMGGNMTPIPVPYGKLDLWLNGFSLIEGIDYLVNYPYVTIINKSYLIPDITQQLTVRATGFVNSKMERILPKDIGFVTHGKIAADDHYDLHDEQVSRIQINGGVYNPQLFDFSLDRGEAVVTPIIDGKPYAIEDYYIPLRGYEGINVYSKYEEDKKDIKQMSDYLTNKIGVERVREKIVLPNLYHVYSPTISKITEDILSNRIDGKEIKLKDKRALDKFIKPYRKWFKLDLAHIGFDKDYVQVDPYPGDTTITLEYREYALLEAIISTYLNGSIDLRPWVTVIQRRNKTEG